MGSDGSGGGLNNKAVSVMQATSQQWQNTGMTPGTRFENRLKPLGRIAVVKRLTQLARQGNALSSTSRRLKGSLIGTGALRD